MGNSTSSQRHSSGSSSFYWGLLLLLLIPPDTLGWNIPFFGGDKSATIHSQTAATGSNSIVEPFGAESASTVAATVTLNAAANNLGDSLVDGSLLTRSVGSFGPVDAPHLRYIPSYFSNQIPERLRQVGPSILSTLLQARIKMHQLLWYKPPVGIVSFWGFFRIMERLYGIYCPPTPTSGEEALADAEGKLSGIIESLIPDSSSKYSPWGKVGGRFPEQSVEVAKDRFKYQTMQLRKKKRREKYRKGRSFDLDRGDFSYDNFGGIETVRVKACHEGLRAALVILDEIDGKASSSKTLFANKSSEKENSPATKTEYLPDIQVALRALQLACPPKGSREFFIEQSAEALSKLQKYLHPPHNNTIFGENEKQTATSIVEQNIHLLLIFSSKLIELRTLDALLRTLRDRHLVVSSRLQRSQNYWKWHLDLSGGSFGKFANKIRSEVLSAFSWADIDSRDHNQKRYETITAAFEKELIWLGSIERLMLERPVEMEVSELLSIVGESMSHRHRRRGLLFGADKSENASTNNAAKISSEATFASAIGFLIQGKNRIWFRNIESWTVRARNSIADSLNAAVNSSFTPIQNAVDPPTDQHHGRDNRIYAESEFLQKWASYDPTFSDSSSWLLVLGLVDHAASPKRAGEMRNFQLSDITNRIKQYDFLGIPSSALLLAAANSLHENIIAPHTQEIIDFAKNVFTAIWGIIEFRFYAPMKDIILDLLNKRPRMVDPFALMNEQLSLDNMLKDLGVGDGSRQARAAALAAASRMYEQEVAGGAIRGIVRGRVAQLLLIQIQQLKADLLQAMDQIDNLVDANRLNIQLVASIPAVLILILGTRALFVFWSNVRMKDLRLPKNVHAEMTDYLKKIEEVLILANHECDSTLLASDQTSRVQIGVCLKSKEMGKLLLWMHLYLNLLDYMSPQFPGKHCDSIHQSMQKMLEQGPMSITRQLQLLKVIQEKHADFLKTL